jgi:protein-tyrosine phosphatase
MELTAVDHEERLFVSSMIDDWTGIEQHLITVVVDLERALDAGIPSRNGTLLYLYYPFEDESLPEAAVVQPLSVFLAELYRSGHRLLIHCRMGLNRSPLVAGAVLHQLGWSGPDAVERLRQCRPGALFNEHYCGYLEKLGSGSRQGDGIP